MCESKDAAVAFHGINILAGGGERASGHVWCETRVVVLPQWQGYGLGPRMSSLVGSALKGSQPRSIALYSTTCHPRLGPWRDRHSNEWRPTWRNHTRSSVTSFGKKTHDRYVYAHKFVGGGLSRAGDDEDAGSDVEAKRRRAGKKKATG